MDRIGGELHVVITKPLVKVRTDVRTEDIMKCDTHDTYQADA